MHPAGLGHGSQGAVRPEKLKVEGRAVGGGVGSLRGVRRPGVGAAGWEGKMQVRMGERRHGQNGVPASLWCEQVRAARRT